MYLSLAQGESESQRGGGHGERGGLAGLERNHQRSGAELVSLDGVTEVYSVAGQYDLVAVLASRNDASPSW